MSDRFPNTFPALSLVATIIDFVFSELTDQPEMYKNHRKTNGFCISSSTTNSSNNFYNVLCRCPFGRVPEGLLRPYCGIFGPSCALLGPSWGVFVPSWGLLEPSWGILRQSWAILRPCWAVLGPSWGHFGAILGPSWGLLGLSWGHPGVILQSSRADSALWAQARDFQAQRLKQCLKRRSAEHGRSPLNK